MYTIFKHELKLSLKSFLIWTLCIGGMGFSFILMFASLQDSMTGMAENFASMGAFSDAFGMSQLSIATLSGFYAAEISTVHALGGSMFAAIISITMLSKEEDGHTGEFLYALPLSRFRMITAKLLALLLQIILLNIFCVGMYMLGIAILGEDMPMKEFFLYHALQILMQTEIAAVCYAASAFMKKNKFGIGLGIVLILYAIDLIVRVVPDLSDYKAISPFSYANAADILSGVKTDILSVTVGVAVLSICIIITYVIYNKRDLMA